MNLLFAKETILLLTLATLISEMSTMTCVPDPAQLEEDYDSDEELVPETREMRSGKPLKSKDCYRINQTRLFWDLSEGTIALSCGKCSIYNVEIRAWKVEQENTPHNKCWGLTPELLTSSLDCMWKKSCDLHYSPSHIVWSPPNSSSCMAEIPDTLEMSYSCLKADTPVTDVIKNHQTLEASQGLLRSHMYDSVHRVTYPKGENLHNRYRVYLSAPSDAEDDAYVMIKVLEADIDSGDKLILQGPSDDCEISAWGKGDTHNLTTRTLPFEFILNSSTGAARGFEICFQWFSHKDADVDTKFGATIKSCKDKKKDFPVFDVIQDVESQNISGFIRSHPKFPWNYPRPYPTAIERYNKTWTSTFHTLRAPIPFRCLRIKVQRLHLAWEDSLEVADDSRKETNLMEHRTYDFQGDTVKINFTVLHTDRHSATGFLLCYLWYTCDREPKINFCEQSVFKVESCKKKKRKQLPKECRERRRKKRKNKKKKKRDDGSKPDEEKKNEEKKKSRRKSREGRSGRRRRRRHDRRSERETIRSKLRAERRSRG